MAPRPQKPKPFTPLKHIRLASPERKYGCRYWSYLEVRTPSKEKKSRIVRRTQKSTYRRLSGFACDLTTACQCAGCEYTTPGRDPREFAPDQCDVCRDHMGNRHLDRIVTAWAAESPSIEALHARVLAATNGDHAVRHVLMIRIRRLLKHDLNCTCDAGPTVARSEMGLATVKVTPCVCGAWDGVAEWATRSTDQR
ncbi:MAG: hypothetical protein ACO35E_06075 [Ilumatobacteraceae bacterium]